MKTKLTILVMTLTMSVFAQIPTTGLVAYYPFDGSAVDMSGNNNDGTVNGATPTTDRFSNTNSAYNFNGTSDYILVNHSPSFNIETWSMSAWYKTSGPLTGTGRITTKSPIGGTNYLTIMMAYDTLFGSAWNGSSQIAVSDNNITNDNNWHHVVYIRNTTTNQYQIYVDNVLKNTVPDVFGSIANSADLYIGSSHINSQFWYGSIDQLRIYNVALTPTDVTALYNEGLCYQTITVTDTLLINTLITGFNPITYQNTIKVYPNPTNDHITIDYGNYTNLNGYTIKITNSLGQVMFTSAINQSQSYIDLSTWTGNGIYFVHIIDAQNNTIDIKKIILN